MPVSGEWEVLTSNGFLCHSPDICRAPSKKKRRVGGGEGGESEAFLKN